MRAAVRALSFAPRPAARQLASQRTNTIGLLLTEISGAFFSSMLRGIEAGVRAAGFALLIYATKLEIPCEMARHPLGEQNTDGLLVFPGSISQAELARLASIGFPVVLLHQKPPPDTAFPFVTVENKSGSEMLVNHLIDAHGKRRIIFLCGPEGHEDSLWRERGYFAALKAHQIPYDPGLVAYGGFDEKDAQDMIQHMVLDGVDFDAVFAGDDDAAIGVIAALRLCGRSVPQDVAVVGFDDVPFARFLSPPLTTIRAPIERVGQEAVRLLVKRIQGQECEPEILLPTQLVIRQSCGCPPH